MELDIYKAYYKGGKLTPASIMEIIQGDEDITAEQSEEMLNYFEQQGYSKEKILTEVEDRV